MKITERPGEVSLSEKVHTAVLKRNYAGASADTTQAPADSDMVLAEEYLMRVLINDEPAMQVVCTPTFLPELVLGRLLTEGYIRSEEEVRLIDVCREGSVAKVYLETSAGVSGPEMEGNDANAVDAGNSVGSFTETVSTCCTDNRMLRDRERKEAGLRKVPQLDWTPEWIWTLDDRFAEDTELHMLTHATHSCFLMLDGKILFEAEDIGRHNAIDKAVGYALRKEIPLSKCILYTTGRMPVDMVRKVIRAGIPVMVSKESPTAEGLRLAKEYGLTLIGNLKHGKMHIYL